MEYRIFISIVDISANLENINIDIDIDIDKAILKILISISISIYSRTALSISISIFSKFADISTIDINFLYFINKLGATSISDAFISLDRE